MEASPIARRYRLLGRLGRGGMGEVYEVIDTVTDRLRAVKLVAGTVDEDAKERVRQEVMIAGRVRSAHVVEVVDGGFDETRDVFYLVMERLGGQDLGALLARRGRLSPAEAKGVLAQVADGLSAIHAEGIVHRDLKPENVVATAAGDALPTAVKIVDFGLAKRFDTTQSVPKTTRALGTPLYMAPEQLRGDGTIDHRADVYAFGQLAFALLTGAPYHAADRAGADNLYALLLRVSAGVKAPASRRARAMGVVLPSGFDRWFSHATAADPADRFPSAREAFLALDGALGSAPSRNPRRIPVAFALAFALVATGIGLFFGRAPSPSLVARAPRSLAGVGRVAPPFLALPPPAPTARPVVAGATSVRAVAPSPKPNKESRFDPLDAM